MLFRTWLKAGGLIAAGTAVSVRMLPRVGVVEERVIVQGSVAQVYDLMADFSNTER